MNDIRQKLLLSVLQANDQFLWNKWNHKWNRCCHNRM